MSLTGHSRHFERSHALPVCPQNQTYRCSALNVAKGHKQSLRTHFTQLHLGSGQLDGQTCGERWEALESKLFTLTDAVLLSTILAEGRSYVLPPIDIVGCKRACSFGRDELTSAGNLPRRTAIG